MKPCIPIFKDIKRYLDRSNNCVTARLLPGDFYVSKNQEMITTVLGSCVSACIYDPSSGYGGMNHFMLPGDDSKTTSDESTRYGLYAMESLINEILKCGTQKSSLKAKLFGGGQIIENMSDVGRKNIHFAKTFLFAEGIPLESSDLGLAYPRKVNFFPHLGKVMVKRLKVLNNRSIEKRERQYMNTLNKKDNCGDIELF